MGRIVDLAVTIEEPFGGEFPPVTLLLIKAGSATLRLRSEAIADWSAIERGNAVVLEMPRARVTVGREKEGEVYLRRDVLDKQILDVSNARMVRVNDVFLIEDGPSLRAAGVDVSLRGLMRRVRAENLVVKIGRRFGARMSRGHIPWNQVEVMRGENGGRIVSKVPTDKLSRLHPTDLAALFSQMNPSERSELIDQLDDETVALALEEADDEIAAEIVQNLDVERAADIIEEMDPDEAADILGEMDSPEAADAILDRFEDREEAADIQHLLTYEEGTAGALMNSDVVTISQNATCEAAIQRLREEEASPQTLYYLHLVDENERLTGVVGLAQAILAPPQTPLLELKEDRLIRIEGDVTPEECAQLIAKYDLLSLPVVDGNGALLGVITFDDVLDEIAPEEFFARKKGERD